MDSSGIHLLVATCVCLVLSKMDRRVEKRTGTKKTSHPRI